MKTIRHLTLLAALLAVTQTTTAQEESDGTTAAPPPPPPATTSGPTMFNPMGSLSEVFGSGIEEISGANWQLSGSSIRLTGNVSVKASDFYISCEELNYDKTTEVMVATGSPVHIIQQGMEAECGHLVYDAKNEQYTLTENPTIIQRAEDGAYSRLENAGKITVTQGADGQPSFMASSDPKKPGTQPTFKVYRPNDNATSGTRQQQPVRVDRAPDLSIIRRPSTSN